MTCPVCGELYHPGTCEDASFARSATGCAECPECHKPDYECQCLFTLRGDTPDKPPVRRSVLTEAQALVHGERNADYGHPLDDFGRTAGMVSAMLAQKLKAPLTAEEIGMIMICVKLSRQINRPKRDNMVDAAGYAETVSWCGDERVRRGG